MYLARTFEAKDSTFRMLEDRAKQLLEGEKMHASTDTHTTFGHLARIHALLTYQILGLLDGDIHQQAMAEGRMGTLMTWVEQMVDSVWTAASVVPGDDSADLVPLAKNLGLGIQNTIPTDSHDLHPVTQEEAVWHTWLFTELLQHTWITVQGLNATYHTLLKDLEVCPGSMKVTAGQGVWDASSSFA